MQKVVVLDTNVLLADPQALLSFPRAEVVIPETVLGELDKLKTARVDPDLRFRGREVSRLLFEFSEEGSLDRGGRPSRRRSSARRAVRQQTPRSRRASARATPTTASWRPSIRCCSSRVPTPM